MVGIIIKEGHPHPSNHFLLFVGDYIAWKSLYLYVASIEMFDHETKPSQSLVEWYFLLEEQVRTSPREQVMLFDRHNID